MLEFNKICINRKNILRVIILSNIINPNTEEEHWRILAEVFRQLVQYSLFVKENKCALFFKQVESLGHMIMAEGISLQASKIDNVKSCPQPKTMTELQQFLGLCNYYCRYILGYTKVAAPVGDLLRGKLSSIHLNAALVQAFQELKNCLVLALVLKVYDPELPIRVQSDASKLAVGAILE